jgi:hypothetical protein
MQRISRTTHLCGTASFFFGYFLFGEAKESSLLPGNPGGVDFVIHGSTGSPRMAY